MNDFIYNTLLAVAAMCSSEHFIVKSVTEVQYTQGFEDCAKIQQAANAETDRRAKIKMDALLAEDRARLANALAALAGRPFKSEIAPGPRPKFDTPCMMLTPGAH